MGQTSILWQNWTQRSPFGSAYPPIPAQEAASK